MELCEIAGLTLDDWQRWLLRESLMVGFDGLHAAGEVGLAVPRQNGKGDLLMARQLVGLYILGEDLAVHSAHEFRTCYEHFLRIVNVIESNPDMDSMVSRIRRGAGDQAVELKDGKRLRFIARSAGAGRGMSGDTVYLDEAFALTTAMMGALLPTLSARRNPQIWYTSSAPKATSEVLHDVRRRGRAGVSSRLLWAEWACDAACDQSDPVQWAVANPAFGVRISTESVRMESEALAPEEFARERLGIPDEVDGSQTVVPLDLWLSLVDLSYQMVGDASVALDVGPDGRWASISGVQVGPDDVAHLEVIDRRPGTDWVVERCKQVVSVSRSAVRVAANGPAAALIPTLRAAGVEVLEVSGVDTMRAAQAFVDAVLNRRLRHLGNTSLQQAITGAARRVSGDMWSWGRASSTADITPLVAASLALAGAVTGVKPIFIF